MAEKGTLARQRAALRTFEESSKVGGWYVGFLDAVKALRGLSGEAFADGSDAEAAVLRRAAEEVAKKTLELSPDVEPSREELAEGIAVLAEMSLEEWSLGLAGKDWTENHAAAPIAAVTEPVEKLTLGTASDTRDGLEQLFNCGEGPETEDRKRMRTVRALRSGGITTVEQLRDPGVNEGFLLSLRGIGVKSLVRISEALA